jgi:hypothetical protein
MIYHVSFTRGGKVHSFQFQAKVDPKAEATEIVKQTLELYRTPYSPTKKREWDEEALHSLTVEAMK